MSGFDGQIESILQAMAAGLVVGCIYGLMCSGLSIIFGVMRVINFAQGEFMMLGMYFTFYLVAGGLFGMSLAGGGAAFLVALLAGVPFYFFGLAIHRGLMSGITGSRSVTMEGEGQHAQLILTLGISLILQNAGLIFFGSTPLGLRMPLSSQAWEIPLPSDLGSIFVNRARSIAAVLSIAVSLALYLFMARAKLGKALRAAADNPVAAIYMGIDVQRCHGIAFGIGTAITAIAGGFVATYYPLQPYVGLEFVVIMYAGVVLGGVESIVGAFWGGLIIGLVQQMSTLVLPYQLQATAIFAVLLIVMMVRPQGLFGRSAERT
jgi:branched-chain amino acid transport system permease protein